MQREVPPELAARLRLAAGTFADIGFDRARIEDITAATGVASSTIYYYLTGKEGLLSFLLSDWLNAVSSSVDAALEAQKGAPAAERLAAIISSHVRLMNEQPATCRVLLAENGRIARLPQLAEAVQAAFHRPVEKVLRDGSAAQQLRVVDVEAVASAVYGAVTLTGLHYLIDARPIPEHLATDLAALMLDGLTVR